MGKDTVGFANGPEIPNVQFAVANTDNTGLGGILGIGQEPSEFMTTWNGNATNATYPNFPQVMKDEGYINKVAYSLYLNEPTAKSGSIVFGGYDAEKYYGSLAELPIQASNRLEVTLDSTTTAGGNTTSLDVSAVLDSGTTQTLIPQGAIDSVAAESRGYNGTAGTYSCTQPDKVFKYNFDGVTIAVPYSELVLPATDKLGNVFLGYCELALSFEDGDPTILGGNFLRHAYVLYDLEDNYISLAQVKYSDQSNLVAL